MGLEVCGKGCTIFWVVVNLNANFVPVNAGHDIDIVRIIVRFIDDQLMVGQIRAVNYSTTILVRLLNLFCFPTRLTTYLKFVVRLTRSNPDILLKQSICEAVLVLLGSRQAVSFNTFLVPSSYASSIAAY